MPKRLLRPGQSVPLYRMTSSLSPRLLLALGLICVYLCAPACLAAQVSQTDDAAADADAEPQNPFPNRHPLPAGMLDGGIEWLNASGDITLRDLKGKVVLFDFWTYCCINCMHVLPDLAYFEKKYPEQLVVVGVHSAKFETEKDTENIRRAIVRYEIEHPVVNDAEMRIWRKFGVRAWPTLVLVDPEGQYCGYISGEGHRDVLDPLIGRLIEYHRAKGTLDESPVQFNLEKHKLAQTPLRFPGKLVADEVGNRLFVSDSNHNRIVVSKLDGTLLDVIGNGGIGADDGSYDEATFDHPQGMTLIGNTLYVADTENHLIRTVDLVARQVQTLAGTGEQARRRPISGPLAQVPLNSPWALAHFDGVLYIAMAGPHQIWSHKLGSETIGVFSGSGSEDIRNGPHPDAAFAQPSGLATDGRFLYVADAEGSAIRQVSFDPEGSVTTVVGTHDLPQGRSLFEFGDRDGVGDDVRLQHPLGVAYRDNVLYVADAYNHKIKKIELLDSGAQSSSWLGNGTRGDSLDPLKLAEPEGLSLTSDTLFIADTNNHRIVAADLQTGRARELKIEGLQPPVPREVGPSEPEFAGDAIKVEPQTIRVTDSLTLTIETNLPPDYKLNALAPLTYEVSSVGDQALVPEDALGVRRKAELRDGSILISVPIAEQPGQVTLQVAVTFGYCRDGTGGLCKIATLHWQIPIETTRDAKQATLSLQAAVE